MQVSGSEGELSTAPLNFGSGGGAAFRCACVCRRSLAGVVSKRQGDIARIAALLHVAHAMSASGDLSNSWLEPVGQQRVHDAVSIVEWSLGHAAAIATEEQLDPMTRKMLRCLTWLRRNVQSAMPIVAKRDLFNGVRAVDLAKVGDLDPVIAELTALKRLAPHTPAGVRAGGRPREEYWVHPEVWV